MTVIPAAIIGLRVRKNGAAVENGLTAQPLEIEADAEVEVQVANLATVRVRKAAAGLTGRGKGERRGPEVGRSSE